MLIKPCVLVLFAVFVLLPNLVKGTEEPCLKNFTLEQVREDLAQLKQLIYDNHPMYFTDKSYLERTIAQQNGLLSDGMTETELYRALAPIGAAVKCGHMRMGLPLEMHDCLRTSGNYLPLEIKVINDSLFVHRDFTAADEVFPGCGILAIDGHTAEQSEVSVPAMSLDTRDSIAAERYGEDPDSKYLDTFISDDKRYAVLTMKTFSYYDDLVEPRPVPENVFTGQLMILINGQCFSSTGHLCALLEYHQAGTFIGTETGGSLACNDASDN